MGTFILKRKRFNYQGDLPGKNQIKGEKVGDTVGRTIGSGVGTAVGGVTGAGIGATAGLLSPSKLRMGANRGKAGLVAGIAGAIGGSILGNKAGKKAGEKTGVAVGGGIGSGVDSAVSPRTYSVSPVTKKVYNVAKKITPKSSRMKLARKAVATDQNVKKAVFEASTNPGGIIQKGVEYGSKNPITGSLIAAGNAALPAIPGTTEAGLVIGKRLDKLGRKSAPKIYKSIESIGSKLAPIARDTTNAAMNVAKGL